MKKNLFIDMDGTIAQFKYRPIEELSKKGYFADLEPIKENLNELRSIASSGDYECFIISAILPESEFAEKEKRDWLRTYFPEVKESNYLFPKCGEDKAVYLGRSLTENDVLIDDRTLNLKQWENAGGYGIKILNNINGLGGTYKGPRIKIVNGGELTKVLNAL